MSIFFPIDGAGLPVVTDVDGAGTLDGSTNVAAAATVTYPPPVYGAATINGTTVVTARGRLAQPSGTSLINGKTTLTASANVLYLPQPRTNWDVTSGGGMTIIVDSYNAVWERLAS